MDTLVSHNNCYLCNIGISRIRNKVVIIKESMPLRINFEVLILCRECAMRIKSDIRRILIIKIGMKKHKCESYL